MDQTQAPGLASVKYESLIQDLICLLGKLICPFDGGAVRSSSEIFTPSKPSYEIVSISTYQGPAHSN